MPIYEYVCTSCGERFDLLQRLSDPPMTECGLCKGTLRKLLGAPALQFKGSGWYVTDYAGKNGSSANTGTNAGQAKEASGGQPSSEASSTANDAAPAAGTPAPAHQIGGDAPACACGTACGGKKGD